MYRDAHRHFYAHKSLKNKSEQTLTFNQGPESSIPFSVTQCSLREEEYKEIPAYPPSGNSILHPQSPNFVPVY